MQGMRQQKRNIFFQLTQIKLLGYIDWALKNTGMHCAPWQKVDNLRAAFLVLKCPFSDKEQLRYFAIAVLPPFWNMRGRDLAGDRPRPTDLLHFKAFIFFSYENLEGGSFESERFGESREFSAWLRFPLGRFGKCKTKLFWIRMDPVTYKMQGMSRKIWVLVQTNPSLADGFPSNFCSSCFSEEMFLMGLMNMQSLLKTWWL